ncbi:molybdopterin molybdotransferase MoeA [soil metagenome]
MGTSSERTSVDEHAALIRSLLVFSPRSETVRLADAVGRVTAENVLSPVDLPLFRNSQMDGYAVLSADLHHVPVTLPVAGVIPAQAATPPHLLPGTAVKIMTGAVVPEGADAVVPVEDTELDGAEVRILTARVAGDFVRLRGSDLRAGDELLPRNIRLSSRHLAVLAAAGLGLVSVVQRIRVAVITTGAELVAAGQQPTLGQIFDANAVALVAAVQQAGAVVAFQSRVTDDTGAMTAALKDAAASADLILTSGGISMGDYEVVREVLEPRGAAVTTIAMQPGGPQATGVFDGVPVISFPGNPVSTQLSFEIFVAPLLRELAGLPAAVRATRILAHDVNSVPRKRQFLRGRLTPDGRVAVVSGASSHLVAGLAASDLLIDIPAETLRLKEGDPVETVLL